MQQKNFILPNVFLLLRLWRIFELIKVNSGCICVSECMYKIYF